MALIISDQLGNQYSLSRDDADGSLQTTPVSNVSASTNDNSVYRTALDVITRALRLVNVVADAELPTSDEANDALESFQEMVDSWNADRLTVYSIKSADFPLTLNQQSFTMGPGGNFDTDRPPKIVGMSVILLTAPANPVEIPIDMYSWSDWQTKIPVKAVNGTFPQVCYDDQGMPLRTLNFWPIPSANLNNVRIYSWAPLVWPATLQTILNFPPSYARAFRYNLAIELAGEFGAQIPQSVAKIATDSLAALKTMNAPDLELVSDLLPMPGGYNYRADQFGIGW